jgi:hypothetical protein
MPPKLHEKRIPRMPDLNWELYRDPIGFLSGEREPKKPASNAVLFSAEERSLRLRLKTWTEDDQIRLVRAIEQGKIIEDGKLTRPVPWRQDEERPDDHIGLGGLGLPTAADAVIRYFDENVGYLGFFKFRFSAIYAHLEWAAGRKPAWWRRIYWAGSFLISGNPVDQDAWIQGFIMLEVAGEKGRLERMAAEVYWSRLRKAWPGGLAAVFSKYFNDAKHPCVVAAEVLGL